MKKILFLIILSILAFNAFGQIQKIEKRTYGLLDSIYYMDGRDTVYTESFGKNGLKKAQIALEDWRHVYNQERPHAALDLNTPASRYTPSPRACPEQLPALEYNGQDEVRKVQGKGELHYQGKLFMLGQAFSGQPVALRGTLYDDSMQVYFGVHRVATLALKEQSLLIEKGRKH